MSNVLRHPTGRRRHPGAGPGRDPRERLPPVPARPPARDRRAHAIAVRAERQQDGISGLVLDAFYHGLAEAGQHNGLRVLLYAQPEDEAAEVATIDELMMTGAADAVVLTATSADDERPAHLRDNGTTFCAFGRPWGHDDEPHDWVDVDGAVGTSLAVRHLLDLGPGRSATSAGPVTVHSPAPAATVDAAGSRSSTRRRMGAPVEAHSLNDAAAAQAAVAELLGDPTHPTRSCARATPSPSARTAPPRPRPAGVPP